MVEKQECRGLNKFLSQKVKTGWSQQDTSLLFDSQLLSNVEHDLKIWSVPSQNQIRQSLESISIAFFFFFEQEVDVCETTEGDSQGRTLYQILLYSDSKQKTDHWGHCNKVQGIWFD